MKKLFTLSLAAIALSVLVSSFAQAPKPVDVAPALKQSTKTAHAAWKTDGGAEFQSGITYFQGVPHLMIMTDISEAADKTLRRKRSIVMACDFLLDDAAFSKVVISVVRYNSKNVKAAQTVSNFEVLRGNYQEAVKKGAKMTDAKQAAQKAKETDSIVASVCADLGVN